jgi:anti-sigma regulatory factor (Ser/Thr protein kinase)
MLVPPQQLQIRTEFDVITLRQAIRQAGRVAGLGPAQQARITAAISEVARALLAAVGDGRFTIRVDEWDAQPALEVTCGGGPGGERATTPSLYATPGVVEARGLVDDARIEAANGATLLLLRVWIKGR